MGARTVCQRNVPGSASGHGIAESAPDLVRSDASEVAVVETMKKVREIREQRSEVGGRML